MGRRASTSINPLWIGLLLIAFTFTVGVGYFVFSMVNDIFRTMKPLDVSMYMENANNLRGNIYKLEGKVINLIRWNPDAGRLISVEVLDPIPRYLPVLVPPSFNGINLQKGQEFMFQIKIGDKGIIHALELRKV